MAIESNQIEPPSRPFQFSLRSLFYFITVLATVCAAGRALEPQVAREFIGFFLAVIFVGVIAALMGPVDSARKRWPAKFDPWVNALVNAIAIASFAAFDHLINRRSSSINIAGSLVTLILICTTFFVVFVLGRLAAVDGPSWRDDREFPYYPVPANLSKAFGMRWVRLLLILGIALVLRFYSVTVVERVTTRYRTILDDSSPNLAVTCILLWGVLWVADCLTRPGKATMGAAIVYIIFAPAIALAI